MTNPALHSRSSVEAFFQVGYTNDNMYAYDEVKSPWGFYPTSGWSSDGDIATIKVASGTITFYSTIPSAISLLSSSFPNLFFRGRIKETGSQYNFGVVYYDYSIMNSPYYDNDSWQTNSLRLSADKPIRSFLLNVEGTVEADYFVFCGDTTPACLILTPLEMDINRAITDEVDTAQIELDYLDYSNYDFLGSHVKIWLAKDSIIASSNYKKVFTGIVEHITKNVEGHEPRDLELRANGYGSYMRKKVFKIGKSLSGTADSVVRGLVEDLVNEGKITTHHVYSTSELLHYTARQNKYVSDALEELADKYDYDFYVDLGGDLYFFKRGSLESDDNIDVDETAEFPYEEDIESVINYQQVIGADTGVIGSDLEWSDQLDNWNASGSLSLDSQIVYGEGAYSLRNSLPSGGTIWFERSFNGEDLSLGGVLTYALQIKSRMSSITGTQKIKTLNEFISPTGTFSVTVESSGGLKSRRSIERYDGVPYSEYPGDDYLFWYYPFAVFEIPFNYKSNTPPDTSGSTIDWTNINTIRIEVLNPIPSLEAVAWLDNFYIKEVYISTIKTDDESISKYGRREGIPIGPDPGLDTYQKIDAIGSIMVNVYKDPIRSATDVKTLRGFDFKPGYEYTISLLEMESIPLILRNIRHEVRGMDFNTYLTFSKRYIPSPEKLLAITKKQLRAYGWDIEAWKNAKQPTNIIPTRSEEIEFWETDLEFPRAALVSSNFQVSLGDHVGNYNQINSSYISTVEIGGGGYYRLRVKDTSAYKAGIEAKSSNIKGSNKIQFRFKAVPNLLECTVGVRAISVGIQSEANVGYYFVFRSYEGNSISGTMYFAAGTIDDYKIVGLGEFTTGNTYDCWSIIDPNKGYVEVFLDEEFMGTANTILTFDLKPFVLTGATAGGSGSIEVEILGYQVAQAW